MTRTCACPCNEPLIGRSQNTMYIDHRHAQRAYRARVKAKLQAAGLPTSLSLASVEASSTTTRSNGDGHTSRRKPQRRRTELRISYRKAVEAVEAGRPLSSALSPKQREALAAAPPTEKEGS